MLHHEVHCVLQIDRHLDERPPLRGQRVELLGAAQGDHAEAVRVQVAKEEPVGPDLRQLRVEPPHLRDGVDLPWAAVLAGDEGQKAVHHFGQPPALEQLPQIEPVKEVREVALSTAERENW